MKFLYLIAILLPISCFGQQQANQQKLKNVAAFARLYGYVRYFHPSDEAASINWDDFAYYGIREVENEKTGAGLAAKLNNLFKPIAPSVLITTQKEPKFSLKDITPPAAAETKDVFWQHSGLGFAGNNMYKSIRVNSINPLNWQEHGVAMATQSIDPKPYRGKRFRLRSSIKVDGSGEGLMFIDIGNVDSSRLFRNMNDHPATSITWQEYEIMDTIPVKALTLTLGAFVRRHGKAWVDNVLLEIEDQGRWIKAELLNPSFENPSLEPGGWKLRPQGRFELDNTNAFTGKHALLLKNDEENGKKIFDQQPSFGEYVKKDIGSGITCIIPLVLESTGKNTYPSSPGNLLKSLEDSIYRHVPSDKTATDSYVRLSGITIAWNIFKHFYPYHEEANTNWDAELDTALEKAYAIQSAAEYLSLLNKLTEKLKDGHVRISRTRVIWPSTIPALATLAEGKIVIEKVAPANTLLKIGDMVTHIDGKPALSLLAELKTEISGSEQWKNRRATLELFDGVMKAEVVLTIKRGDEAEKEVKLSRGNFNMFDNKPDIRKLNEDTYYVNLGSTPIEYIERASDLLKAKNIIFDLRGYPQNNKQIINQLLSEPDTCNWMFTPKIIRPDLKGVYYKPFGWKLKPMEPHISAKIVFLTGGGAISFSESFMAYIKHHKLGTIVGQPTAGANGDVNKITLPGSYSISFSGLKVRQHGGSPLHALGIKPDIIVNRTIAGITAGRDEFLEKALEILNQRDRLK
jgi:C-terminal processing protease CtpA/Prc